MLEKLIFEHSTPGRSAAAQYPVDVSTSAIPDSLRRRRPPVLPEVSELQAVRHFTRLSQLNFSIDTHFYPLGSCTMKYNPKVNEAAARMSGFADLHPLAPDEVAQRALALLHATAVMLGEITGLPRHPELLRQQGCVESVWRSPAWVACS